MKRTRGEEEGGRHEEEKVEKEAEDKPGGGRKTRRKKNNNIANEGEGGKANYWEMKKKRFPFPPGLELPLPPDAAYSRLFLILAGIPVHT